MKKILLIIILLFATFFANLSKAQIANQKLKYFAVLTESNLINNNPYTIKGQLGANFSVSGKYGNVDSVYNGSSIELSEAISELSDLKTYLNSVNGETITSLEGIFDSGVYRITSNYQTNISQDIKFIGSNTDIIIININGDLILDESTNIILQGILPENIYWNISGNLRINRKSWVYGTFIAIGDIIISDDIKGAISTFSESDITLGESDVLRSHHFLTLNIDLSHDDGCSPLCVVSNLVVNGHFSNDAVCSDIPYSNQFSTDLRYKLGDSLPCYDPKSRSSFYKIDDHTDHWNRDTYSLINDHTGDEKNILFVDGFNIIRVVSANSSTVYFDTTNVIIWEQNISVIKPGKVYQFSMWSTNISTIYNVNLKIRFLINNIEVPNTRYTITANDIKWRQHCFLWTAPGNIGDPNIPINIKIMQVDFAEVELLGKDVVIDDIVFGEKITDSISIVSNTTSNYCTGNSTTLSIINPIIGYNYQWMLNGSNISGATGNTYVATVAGNYSVNGNSNQGCLISSTSLAVTITTLVGENINVAVTTSQTWTPSINPLIASGNTVWIKNSMSIAPGVDLTIKGMRFEFSPNAIVYVHAGATLTLESENGVPTIFTAYDCPNTMWNGIKIYSTTSANGKLVITPNCVIEYARIGVSNEPTNYKTKVNFTGYVEATGAIFRNNYIAVQLVSKAANGSRLVRVNKSKFTSCQFLTNANMKDVISYADGRHKTFVDLSYVNGVLFNTTIFKNSILNPNPASVNNVYDEAKVTQNKGISSIASSYKLAGCEFINLWVGADFASGSSAYSNQQFQSSSFKSVAYGIILRGGSGIIVDGCTFMVDPFYTTGSSKVPKFFVGINSRGSVGYTFSNNIFSEGYCGIISKSAGVKNFKSNIYKNTFVDVGKKNKGAGQGIYMLGSNQPVQVSCNTFISTDVAYPVQNHWVSDGIMSAQGKCDPTDPTAPAGNRFEQVNPVNADIYAKHDESGFIYNTHSTSIAEITPLFKEGTANMTSVYVNNCAQLYDSEKACEGAEPRDINVIRDDINSAVNNEDAEALSYLLFEALQYYEEADTTGQSSIELLNETPHIVAKWMLVARYIQAERYDDANDLLEILPVITEEEQAEKAFYQLLVQLENNDASIIELDQSAIDQLTELAESEFYVSYEAQGILHYLYGNAYYIPLPYEEESERPFLNPDSTSSLISQFSIYPNPSTGTITIDKPTDVTIAKIELQNINGAVIVGESVLKSNQVELGDVPNGMYIVAIYTMNGDRIMKKLIIAK